MATKKSTLHRDAFLAGIGGEDGDITREEALARIDGSILTDEGEQVFDGKVDAMEEAHFRRACYAAGAGAYADAIIALAKGERTTPVHIPKLDMKGWKTLFPDFDMRKAKLDDAGATKEGNLWVWLSQENDDKEENSDPDEKTTRLFFQYHKGKIDTQSVTCTRVQPDDDREVDEIPTVPVTPDLAEQLVPRLEVSIIDRRGYVVKRAAPGETAKGGDDIFSEIEAGAGTVVDDPPDFKIPTAIDYRLLKPLQFEASGDGFTAMFDAGDEAMVTLKGKGNPRVVEVAYDFEQEDVKHHVDAHPMNKTEYDQLQNAKEVMAFEPEEAECIKVTVALMQQLNDIAGKRRKPLTLRSDAEKRFAIKGGSGTSN